VKCTDTDAFIDISEEENFQDDDVEDLNVAGTVVMAALAFEDRALRRRML
jgi:hypothetical protein